MMYRTGHIHFKTLTRHAYNHTGSKHVPYGNIWQEARSF